MLKPNSQVTTNLIKARELIADEKNWCVGEFTNQRGQHCIIGAMVTITGETVPGKHPLRDACQELFGHVWIAQANNTLGHAAVMRMFDRAIELSLQEQGESQ